MMNDKFYDYINTHPRESLFLAIVIASLIWQSVAALIGIVLYLLLVRVFRVPWWLILGTGIVIAAGAVFFQQYYLFSQVNVFEFVFKGFELNITFLKCLFRNGVGDAFSFLCHRAENYVIGFPLMIAGML